MSSVERKRRTAARCAARLMDGDPDLIGVWLVNSAAAGDCDPDSDVDLLAVSRETARSERFDLDGETIDLGVFPRRTIVQALEDDLEFDFHAWKIAGAIELQDPEGELKKMREWVTSRPPERVSASFRHHAASAADYARRAMDRAGEGRMGEAHNALQTAAVRLWCALHPLTGRYRRDQAPDPSAFKGAGETEGIDLDSIGAALGMGEGMDAGELRSRLAELEALIDELEGLGRETFGAR